MATKATFSVSKKLRATGQEQITVIGVRHPEGGHISTSKAVMLTFPSGKQVVMGDTNGLWLHHQKTEEQRIQWKAINEKVEPDAPVSCMVEVTDAGSIKGKSEGSSSPVSVDELL